MRKPLSQQALVRKLDKIFSLYIRKKNCPNNVCRCCSCGKIGDISEFDAGHFIGRQYKQTRWSEKNVHPQCRKCNRFTEGNKDEYALFLVRKYGANILEELNVNKYLPFKLDTLWLQEIIKEYEAKLKEL